MLGVVNLISKNMQDCRSCCRVGIGIAFVYQLDRSVTKSYL